MFEDQAKGESKFNERVATFLGQLGAEAYYENHHRGGGKGIFDKSSETRFGYRLGVKPVSRLSVIWEVQFTYEPDGTGGFQRRRLFNLQSRIDL